MKKQQREDHREGDPEGELLVDCDAGEVSDAHLKAMSKLFDRLMRSYVKTSFIRERQDCEFQEFRPSASEPIIDEIERALAAHYGFTDEELDLVPSTQLSAGPSTKLRAGNHDITGAKCQLVVTED
ncbi:MAG: hypothetical protein ACXW6J_26995, partial [Candidatus Binatia bacterium]